MPKKLIIFETPFETYTSVDIIGEGGSGRVYSVTNSDGKYFALKCMSPDKITSAKLKRFKNEIQFCQRNPHNNIVKILDTGSIQIKNKKCPFYVMTKYHGTLRTLMDSGIQPNMVLPLFSKLLDGVEAAHLMSVWHRDLKPENILWEESSEEIVIADFGIAHFEVEDIYTAIETKINSRMANFRYSAPEQRERNAEVNYRSDLFSLGLILNEMFTGQVIQGSGYTRIYDIDKNYSYLDDIIESLTQQKPENRPDSIEVIKKELIGRKNTFIALQDFDESKNKIIPVAELSEFTPVKLVSMDYSNGTLILKLNKSVPVDWAQEFRQPKSSYRSIMGYEPSAFSINGSTISIGARENQEFIQNIVNSVKTFVEMANKGYEIKLRGEAKQKEQKLREKLENEIKESELRKNILENVTI